MKYPFLLAALLLCSANLAARHPDTDTLLQPDTLSLRQSDALSAQKSDAPFVRPPYLRPGDTIGIVTPARKLKEKADTAKVRERFEEWGLKVKFGAHYADREQPYFAGTDARRAADLQAMIDDPGVKAVVSYQGGYGSVRLLPLLDLTRCANIPSGSSVQRRHHAPHGAGAVGRRKPSRHDAGQVPLRRR
ncbi:MAG: LD-carboxypeptidase [Alistipes finegoldii]